MIAIKKEGEEAHFCKNHPEEPATAQCKSCGAYLCYDCKCYHYGANYCESCFAALRQRQASGDWIFPTVAKAIVAVSAILILVTAVRMPFELRGADAGSLIMMVSGAALWHVADVALIVSALWALKFRPWARKGLIAGGALGIVRGVAWPAFEMLSGEPFYWPLAVFYIFVIIYGASTVFFYASKALRDEFRAVRP